MTKLKCLIIKLQRLKKKLVDELHESIVYFNKKIMKNQKCLYHRAYNPYQLIDDYPQQDALTQSTRVRDSWESKSIHASLSHNILYIQETYFFVLVHIYYFTYISTIDNAEMFNFLKKSTFYPIKVKKKQMYENEILLYIYMT